jgi:hypothetical protein
MANRPYGVTIGSQQIASGNYLKQVALDDMKAAGYTDLRFQVPAHLVRTGPNTYNWGIWDDAVAKCNTSGIALCLTVKDPGSASPSVYAEIGAAVAKRYDGKSGHGHIEFIEDGNEDFDWGAGISPIPLVQSLKAFYPAVKAANPDLPVVMGSILQRNSTHIRSFMDGVWSGADGYFDVANFHFYTCIPGNGKFAPDDESVPNVPSLRQFIEIMRSSHKAAGHENFPTWCSEFGFAVNPNYGRDLRCVTDDAHQWAYLKYCYDLMRTSGFITKSHIFTFGYHTPLPDGMSLVQGGRRTLAYTKMIDYTKQYSSWDGSVVEPPPPPDEPPPDEPPPSEVITIPLTNFTGTVTITPKVGA